MPVYQDNGGARWDGAAYGSPNAPTPREINKHIGMPSNGFITNSQLIKSWANRNEEDIREGQIMFSARSNSMGRDRRANQVSFQHLQDILFEAYQTARAKLRAGTLPHGINLTAERFDALREEEIMDFLGKEHLIPEDAVDLRQACALLKIQDFKYLLPHGVMYYWNFFGGVNNISKGTSMETKIDESMSRAIVVNSVVAKKCFLSNIWGDNNRVVEGGVVTLVVRRAMNADGLPMHTEIVPWACRDYETAPYQDRGYYAMNGCFQPGFEIYVGTCTEVDGQVPAENKRRIAISSGKYDRRSVHDAYGGLPQIVVQIGI